MSNDSKGGMLNGASDSCGGRSKSIMRSCAGACRGACFSLETAVYVPEGRQSDKWTGIPASKTTNGHFNCGKAVSMRWTMLSKLHGGKIAITCWVSSTHISHTRFVRFTDGSGENMEEAESNVLSSWGSSLDYKQAMSSASVHRHFAFMRACPSY